MSLGAWLFDTRGAAWKYVLRMVPTTLVPALLISVLLALLGVAREGTVPVFDSQLSPATLFVGLVVISPVGETLVMAVILKGFSFAIRNRVHLALASAVVWAILHSLAAVAWGLAVFWPFFVFSCAYLAWREQSRRRGFLVATSIHMLHNLLPTLVLLAAL
jgi:hypothetical protein